MRDASDASFQANERFRPAGDGFGLWNPQKMGKPTPSAVA